MPEQPKTLVSQLDRIIAPEIKDDKFYRAIRKIASMPDVRTILEIGASSGGGSTEAFVAGALKQKTPPDVYSIEVSKARFENLEARWRGYAFVHCYNVSSVPIDSFPSEDEIDLFWNSGKSILSKTPLNEVLQWLRQDIEYLSYHNMSQNGIREIKEQNGIEVFDAVLIDGSEFTGKPELEEVYGARFLLLDDVLSFKNYENHTRLLDDPNYRLWKKGLRDRNGFSIFEKR